MIQFLADYQSLIVWSLSAIGIVFMAIMAKKFASKSDHDQLRTDFDAAILNLDKRTTAVETHMKDLPSKAEFNELKISLVELGGEIKNAMTKFDGADKAAEKFMDRMQGQVDRMEEFLKVAR